MAVITPTITPSSSTTKRRCTFNSRICSRTDQAEVFRETQKTAGVIRSRTNVVSVSEVLDHLETYRGELETLMTEKFHIIDKRDIPVQYREAA